MQGWTCRLAVRGNSQDVKSFGTKLELALLWGSLLEGISESPRVGGEPTPEAAAARSWLCWDYLEPNPSLPAPSASGWEPQPQTGQPLHRGSWAEHSRALRPQAPARPTSQDSSLSPGCIPELWTPCV